MSKNINTKRKDSDEAVLEKLAMTPEVIDKTPRQDKEIFPLPKPKTMSAIEGDIEIEDKERRIVLTSVHNKKKEYSFKRLYDLSGKNPVLIASGCIDYKDGMFIVHPNKICDDRGDYLKDPQSALYKFDENNKPQFVAANVLKILNNDWFEQRYTMENPYLISLCKCENTGKYRRIMNFDDYEYPHEITVDNKGTFYFVDQEYKIIDNDENFFYETEFTGWCTKKGYEYDAKNNTLRLVACDRYKSDKQEGVYKISPDIEVEVTPQFAGGYDNGYLIRFRDTNKDDVDSTILAMRSDTDDIGKFCTYKDNVLTIKNYYNASIVNCYRGEDGKISIQQKSMNIKEMKEGISKYVTTCCGTFFDSSNLYGGGIFMRNDESVNRDFNNCGISHRAYVGTILPSGLADVCVHDYNGIRQGVYDFKTSSYRDDLISIRGLGDKLCAVKKTGEEQFGIYERADEKFENPLFMVDCLDVYADHVLYLIGDTKYSCEITSKGKLKPIAKQTQIFEKAVGISSRKDLIYPGVGGKDLYLSTGGQWVKVELPKDARTYLSFDGISGGIELSNDDALKFAHTIYKNAKKEQIKEVREGYHNTKARIKAARDKMGTSDNPTTEIKDDAGELSEGIKPSKRMRQQKRPQEVR